jgi:inner membrane protein
MLPIDLPVLPLAVLLGAIVFFGLISHLFADALTIGWDAHAIRPTHPLSPHPFRFEFVREDPDSPIPSYSLAACWSKGLRLGCP